ncbi:MAG: hypothetical protein KME17_26435 [Cyanosarcina radialis HA8281-LM2]|nr:hypothetical protein [Cyanosarcina radialis HA8281-LM2]
MSVCNKFSYTDYRTRGERGKMGRWGDGEMGRWGDGEMGRWGAEGTINN